MTWVVLGVLLVLLLAAVPARRALAARRERELVAREAFRVNRKLLDEDVTVFGEQLAELHVDTLAAGVDGEMRRTTRTRSRPTTGPRSSSPQRRRPTTSPC